MQEEDPQKHDSGEWLACIPAGASQLYQLERFAREPPYPRRPTGVPIVTDRIQRTSEAALAIRQDVTAELASAAGPRSKRDISRTDSHLLKCGQREMAMFFVRTGEPSTRAVPYAAAMYTVLPGDYGHFSEQLRTPGLVCLSSSCLRRNRALVGKEEELAHAAGSLVELGVDAHAGSLIL